MKKVIKFSIPAIFILGIGFMLFKTYEKVNHTKQIEKQIKEIPQFSFNNIQTKSEFTNKDLQKNRTTVFLYFNTECEHCRYELQQVSDNLQKFKNAQIIMISIEEPVQIKAFTKKYNLLNQSNLYILFDKDIKFEEIFGNCPFPTTFIYNKKGALVKQFKGEVRVEALLKYLNE